MEGCMRSVVLAFGGNSQTAKSDPNPKQSHPIQNLQSCRHAFQRVAMLVSSTNTAMQTCAYLRSGSAKQMLCAVDLAPPNAWGPIPVSCCGLTKA